MKDLERIVKRLMKERVTSDSLGIGIKGIRELQRIGYNVKSENVGGRNYYWIKLMDNDNHYIVSHASSKEKEITWAEVSDIHAGAKTFDEKGFRWFLKEVKDRGIRHIHCSGDSFDGINVYPGQVNYLRYFSEPDQVRCLSDILGEFEGCFKWILIDGNHDMSWVKVGATSPNELLSKEVKNIVYIPGAGADKIVRGDIVIEGIMKRMVHPYSNSARSPYAISYPGQVYLRNVMNNGVQFEIADKKYFLKLLQIGHYHTEMEYRSFGAIVTHPLSFQKPNDYTEGKGLIGPRGGRITKMRTQNGEVKYHNSEVLEVPQNP